MKWPATAIGYGLPLRARHGRERATQRSNAVGQVKTRVDGGRRKYRQMARLQVRPSRTRGVLHPLCTISRLERETGRPKTINSDGVFSNKTISVERF